MLIAGIDVGLHGAIALLNGKRLLVSDMPTHELIRGGKKKHELDIHKLAQELTAPITHCYVEKVNSMPGQGVSSVFSFGTSYGIVLGILAAYKIPYTLVPPMTWKKALNVPAAKDASRARASQLLPQHAGIWSKVKHDGRAESALIALYGWRQQNGVSQNAG